MSTPSIEDVLAQHGHTGGTRWDNERKTTFSVCRCGVRLYLLEEPRFESHVADAIRAHLAEHTDEAAEAVAELAVIQNLAMEHMNCSGCPTPWWLKQALGGEQ